MVEKKNDCLNALNLHSFLLKSTLDEVFFPVPDF